MTVAVAGRRDCLELELANRETRAVDELLLDPGRLPLVVRRVETEGLCPVETDLISVGDADRRSGLGTREQSGPGGAFSSAAPPTWSA